MRDEKDEMVSLQEGGKLTIYTTIEHKNSTLASMQMEQIV